MKTKVKVIKNIKEKGFPTSSKYYPTAHKAADKAEKKAYPKGYEDMKKVDKRIESKNKHAMAGKNLKSGVIEVSEKVPKSHRKEVALHEKRELQAIKKLEKLHGRRSVKK